MSNIQRNIHKKKELLSIILVAYIYVPYVVNILEHVFKFPPISEYIIYMLLAVFAVAITVKINRFVLLFLCMFFAVILINCAIVPYKYYVVIEGVQALIRVSIPCLCISNSLFDLKVFIEKWWLFSKRNLPLVLLAIVLLKQELIPYSIFTSICVPNAFIGSYMVLQGIEKRKWLYINIAFNILVTAVLGGRMAAVISVCMIFISYVYSEKIKLWKKVILILGTIIFSCVLLSNLLDLLYWINQQLSQYGIESRSVNLLIDQIKNNEVYLTNRDYIYTVCIEYIKSRMGLPGGFGIPLYITSGEYYYTHNILLQFLTCFGLGGSIIVFGSIIVRGRILKNIASLKCRKFIYFLMVCYIGIGMTGSSIWIHYLSTIFIAIFFFGDKNLYQSL